MKKSFLVLPVLFFSIISTYAQSPWTPGKGKAYTQLAFNSIPKYTLLFGAGQTPEPEETYRVISDYTLEFYGEYGLGQKNSFIAIVPYKFLSAGDKVNDETDDGMTQDPGGTFDPDRGELYGFSNITLGYKRVILEGNYTFSGQLNLSAPTSNYQSNTGLRTGYECWIINPIFSLGRGFEKSYFSLFSGYQYRTNNYTNNVVFGGEYGVTVEKKFTFALYIDAVMKVSQNENSRTNKASNASTGLYVNGQEYIGWGIKAMYTHKEKVGLLALFGGAFYGHLVPAKLATNFGVFVKL